MGPEISLASTTPLSCSDRLAFGCWLFGSSPPSPVSPSPTSARSSPHHHRWSEEATTLSPTAFATTRSFKAAVENADAVLPIVHVLFSNVKAWLNGTLHGVSAKHLPHYAREWNYRFNRRRRIADLTDFLLRRAATRATITYRQLINGAQVDGALPALTG
jgi:ISXO2 transposase-like protein